MSFSPRLEDLPRQFAILVTVMLSLAAAQVQAQTSPAGDEAATTDPSREIAVAPSARDTEIADRLESILEASEWFSPVSVSVREGIVFLDGQTETDERRNWAQQLASRTQDVVAVINRIEVKRPISWDLTPT